MNDNELSRYASGTDLEYIINFVTASNHGYSKSFIGNEVITSLILALRDTNDRLKSLEELK